MGPKVTTVHLLHLGMQPPTSNCRRQAPLTTLTVLPASLVYVQIPLFLQAMKAVSISVRRSRSKLNKSDHGDHDDVDNYLMDDNLPMTTTRAKLPTKTLKKLALLAPGLRCFSFVFAALLCLLQFQTLSSVCDFHRSDELSTTTTWRDHRPTGITDIRKFHDDDSNRNGETTITTTNDGE